MMWANISHAAERCVAVGEGGLGFICSPPQESGATSKKDKKSKSVSVLHGCPGLKGCPVTTQWHADCSHSSVPGLLRWVDVISAFWPCIPWKDEFPPQCITMLQEAKARADACCDVNLMTSRCLDGTSKRAQWRDCCCFFCFFTLPLLHSVGEGPPLPVLLLSSGHQTVEPVWVVAEYNTTSGGLEQEILTFCCIHWASPEDHDRHRHLYNKSP